LEFESAASPRQSSNRGIGQTLAELDGWLGDEILWLAGLHAVAAFYHYWILGDGVLVSMLPAWLPLRPKRTG